MKLLGRLIGVSIVLGGMVACQQKIAPSPTTLSGPITRLDTLALDSTKLGLDTTLSLPLDSLTTSLFVRTGAYEEIFEVGTAYETRLTIYTVQLDTAKIVLLNGNYKNLNELSKQYPKGYSMLTNAGMFHPKGDPVGLFQNDSGQLNGINTVDGYGNFFLRPNGVFYIAKDNQAGVLETAVFLDSIYNKETALQVATQSGPMLVIDGEYHPKFNQGSSSKYIRSGVGVTDRQEIVFILSEELVNLHTFARIFIEKGCKNALYLDGAISSMYIKNRADSLPDFTTRYGPVLGVYALPDSLRKVALVVDSLTGGVLDPLENDSLSSLNNDSLLPPNLIDNATEK
ncbi:MAG: phosphodiester glycosidase family protein [Aureispira sp.]